MKSVIKVIAAIVVGIALMAGMFYVIHLHNMIPENPPSTVGNTAGNLFNGGLFCEAEDGRVYFSNSFDGGSIYSMMPDESDMKKLNKFKSKWINSGGDYLYYYQSADGSAAIAGYSGQVMGVYRQKKDSKKAKCLDRTAAGAMVLLGSKLYYQHNTNSGGEGMTIYRMSIDKKDYGMLANEILDPSCVAGGSIYYAGVYGGHNLYRLDTSSGHGSQVYQGDVWNPVFTDSDNFYFMNVKDNYRVHKGSISSGQSERITQERADCFNIAGGYVYYQASEGDEPGLMRCRLDGSDSEMVTPGYYTAINATSRYVYFMKFGDDKVTLKTSVNGPASSQEFSNARSAVTTAEQ